LYELLVPQAFDYKKLLYAYMSGKYRDMTDETRVMFEHYGITPDFVQGGGNLFKVTYPNDINILESIA
jgi:2-C-methyl-D-erythritol 4-phosphate cytidylyltransferase